MEEKKKIHMNFSSGDLKGDHSQYLGTHKRIILKWILNNCDGRVWTGFIWYRIGSVSGHS
jgi:hypothetical protein